MKGGAKYGHNIANCDLYLIKMLQERKLSLRIISNFLTHLEKIGLAYNRLVETGFIKPAPKDPNSNESPDQQPYKIQKLESGKPKPIF